MGYTVVEIGRIENDLKLHQGRILVGPWDGYRAELKVAKWSSKATLPCDPLRSCSSHRTLRARFTGWSSVTLGAGEKFVRHIPCVC